ncbi:hypothetical protein KXD40_008583 [Peronospora effusa]|uniref:Serine aminopeptidase S33 domain-containing protein n=1 Tax=Peronospora effusa TaxID=542832 RepID=A0A3M6VKM0_9STRA|nr:hypothetical protein DD238_002274 [Peronospora effusa]RQM17792.1 hypothetical protein DD237_001664 [Peronospora effusa]UIZ24521.1 hypothetical protein KXD40_008583 [Peronospora effusa]
MRKIDFKNERTLSTVIDHRILCIEAANDVVLKPVMARGIDKVMPNLEAKLILGTDHWVLWEKAIVNAKEEFTAILSEWLAKIAAGIDADAKL